MQTLQHVLTLKHEQSVEHSHTLGHEQSTEHVHVQILVTQNTTQERKMYIRKKEKKANIWIIGKEKKNCYKN